MARRTERRKGEHGDARHDVVALHGVGNGDGDLSQVLGRWLDVHGGVGEEVDLALGRDDHVHAGDALHILFFGNQFERGPDRVGVVLGNAGDQRVGVAGMHHHRGEARAGAHVARRFGHRDALAAAHAQILLQIGVPVFAANGIDDLDLSVEVQVQFGGAAANRLLVAKQDGESDVLVHQNLGGAQDFVLIALGKDDALGMALRLMDDHAHDLLRLAEPALERFAVLVDVDVALRDAALHGGAGHGGRDPGEHARVERLGNDIAGAEFHLIDAVSAAHRVGHVLAGQIG